MKKLLALLLALLLAGCAAAPAAPEENNLQPQAMPEVQKMAKQSQAELNAKASKAARKESKTLAKEGWTVAPGHLPLEKQLDKSYNMYYEYEENGLPKYIIGEAMSVGGTYDAAKMQTLELAKTNLAGQIQTEVTALVESTVANEQITSEDAASIVQSVQASMNLISKRLGRVFPVVELYRKVNKSTMEVRVTIAYNSVMAIDAAKEVVRAEL